ncbi:hypothetical protein BKE38_19340 [Pseudoroseomonas deserti]|uniref:RNA polymerase subunit sigma-70 n=1 Tax=Teichococcus deserti TaxID=1817963 RepID=A0A1V2H0G3_9PROT|nr:sigma-70 family RNA polymerase sigma factor [Pseudoroseomonas deserti]ONG50123.1 hypothetical protein BKE38_19340 [Pseudoroseomonas deserti]
MSQDHLLIEAFLGHRPALLKAAFAVLRDRNRAEDVLQDAYLRLCSAPPLARVEQPLCYLFRMTRNLAIDAARHLSREGRLREGLAPPPAIPSPEDEAAGRDRLRRLEAALAELPDRTRLVFEMSRIGGYTVDHVAATLGISPRLVHLHLRDAMTHCRGRVFPAGER